MNYKDIKCPLCNCNLQPCDMFNDIFDCYNCSLLTIWYNDMKYSCKEFQRLLKLKAFI